MDDFLEQILSTQWGGDANGLHRSWGASIVGASMDGTMELPKLSGGHPRSLDHHAVNHQENAGQSQNHENSHLSFQAMMIGGGDNGNPIINSPHLLPSFHGGPMEIPPTLTSSLLRANGYEGSGFHSSPQSAPSWPSQHYGVPLSSNLNGAGKPDSLRKRYRGEGEEDDDDEIDDEATAGNMGPGMAPQNFQSGQGQLPQNAAEGTNGTARPRVRARRGQATDPHSIAERNRRERIAERMKALQELVPDANKTDKASMLDEIIGYVRFLQMQVKCLSACRLGGAGAAAPLFADLPVEGVSNFMGATMGQSNGVPGGGSSSQDAMVYAERQVARLMDEDMSAAMQYLQNKGLCLMPISLATAISSSTTARSHALASTKGSEEGDNGSDMNMQGPEMMSSLGRSMSGASPPLHDSATPKQGGENSARSA